MNRRRVFYSIVGLLLISACGLDEGDFIAGADEVSCQENIPVCETTAGCLMGESTYIEGDLPGTISFVVTTPANTTIVVKLFFETEINPGENTTIIWYEPGCGGNIQSYQSGGVDDIFSMAGGDRVFSQEKTVSQAGDHLIEIVSDAYVHYFARVDLITP